MRIKAYIDKDGDLWVPISTDEGNDLYQIVNIVTEVPDDVIAGFEYLSFITGAYGPLTKIVLGEVKE